MTRFLALVVLLALAACKSGGGSSTPPVNPNWQPSLDPAAWNVRYSPQQPQRPGVGWIIAFPIHTSPIPCYGSQDPRCPAVHYITTPARSLTGAKSITFSGTIATTGGASFGYKTEPGNTCDTRAHVRLLLQRTGDESLNTDAYRFWSNPGAVALADGTFALTVPLTPDKWSSVFGHSGAEIPAGFADTLANLGNVGFTFGGGCFFGHGVYIDKSTATFTLTAFAVQR